MEEEFLEIQLEVNLIKKSLYRERISQASPCWLEDSGLKVVIKNLKDFIYFNYELNLETLHLRCENVCLIVQRVIDLIDQIESVKI